MCAVHAQFVNKAPADGVNVRRRIAHGTLFVCVCWCMCVFSVLLRAANVDVTLAHNDDDGIEFRVFSRRAALCVLCVARSMRSPFGSCMLRL